MTETLKIFCHEIARLLLPNLIPVFSGIALIPMFSGTALKPVFSGTALKHYIPLIFLAPAVLESNWEKKLMLFSMMDFTTCRLACFAYLT